MASSSPVTDRLINILQDSEAQKVLDVGCGAGALTKLLSEAGFDMTGIDPFKDAISKAVENVPAGRFLVAGGEDIPLPECEFDAVVLLNSFHHIPQELLPKSLREFERLLKRTGELVIAEPLTRGSFFEAMLPVEDETEIRHYALDVLQKACASADWQLVSREELDRVSRFETVEKFIATLVAVDPAREQAAIDKKTEIEHLFFQHATPQDGAFILTQPHVIWRMKPEG